MIVMIVMMRMGLTWDDISDGGGNKKSRMTDVRAANIKIDELEAEVSRVLELSEEAHIKAFNDTRIHAQYLGFTISSSSHTIS